LKYAGRELGVTLVLVTHDLSVAEQAERVITLEDGCIVRDTLDAGASREHSSRPAAAAR
jgi:ABC-type lipoprotein export system ATPase subunit